LVINAGQLRHLRELGVLATIEGELEHDHGRAHTAFVYVDPTLAAALATAHTRTFVAAAMETSFGVEELTADVPNASATDVAEVDERGLVREGTGRGRDRVGSAVRGRRRAARRRPRRCGSGHRRRGQPRALAVAGSAKGAHAATAFSRTGRC
jgi:hypothetical protein